MAGRAKNSDANIELPVKITIDDLRGDGDHYAAQIITEEFKGKTRVQQHQMIYNAMEGKVGKELHALALNTSAPKD